MIESWAFWPLLALGGLLIGAVGYLLARALGDPGPGRHGPGYVRASAVAGAATEGRGWGEGGRTAAGSDTPPAPFEPALAWCERRWHDGQCCPASAEQYAMYAAAAAAGAADAPAIDEAAAAEPAEVAAAAPGTGELADVTALYMERIRRVDKLTPKQLLDVAIYVCGWDGECIDRALELLEPI